MKVTPVDPFELAAKLGVDLSGGLNGAAAQQNGQPVADAVGDEREPIDLDAYPAVREAIGKVSDPPDRSEDTFYICAVCAECGLSLAQARWAVDQRADLSARLADRRNGDDVLTAWERAVQRTAWVRQAQAAAQPPPRPGPAAAPRPQVNRPPLLKDAFVGEYIADARLAGEYLYSGTFHWMRYDGRVWVPTDESIVSEVIRLALIQFVTEEIAAGADDNRRRMLVQLLGASRIKAIMTIAKGRVARESIAFDAQPWLINAGNGVVDLRDGSLNPHDPDLLFTKLTPVDYYPDRRHDDWDTALTAVTPEVADWLQLRFGQGLTGFPPPDDLMVILKGSGENGKSTLIDGINAGAGQYATPLPDRVLMSRSGDHPTELMELRDARLAFMEEFPEIGHLNVRRLKAATGTQVMSARYCGRDTVKWVSTHSLFVTTNYLPRVDESDHGTWRRLALVEFPYRYRKVGEDIESANDRRGDPGLRDRIRLGDRGQHEAALAWLVAGAMRWFADGRVMPLMPPAVAAATAAWRGTADLLGQYIEERLVIGGNPDGHVMATDLYTDFKGWLGQHGHQSWTDQTFSSRFGQHPAIVAAGASKNRVRATQRQSLSRPVSGFGNPPLGKIPAQYFAWSRVEFQGP